MTLSYDSVIKQQFSKRNVRFLTGALLILVGLSTYFFGFKVLVITLVSVFVAFLVELMFSKGRKIAFDEAWVIYPLIFALLVPSTLDLKYVWMVGVGSAFGTFFGKGIFGGSGKYVFHPALVGLLFVTVSFPAFFPTMLVKPSAVGDTYSLLDMFIGGAPGALGETFRVGLLVIGLVLVGFKVIDWKVPLTILISVFVLEFLGGMFFGEFQDPVTALLVGNLIFVSFFIASDETVMPLTTLGRILFGIGVAFITVLIRDFATYPEGTMFALILMSAISPLIDNLFVKEVETDESKS